MSEPLLTIFDHLDRSGFYRVSYGGREYVLRSFDITEVPIPLERRYDSQVFHQECEVKFRMIQLPTQEPVEKKDRSVARRLGLRKPGQ